MSDIETSNWSETAASNNAAPPNGMPEGMAPSGVNDSGREIMAAIKRDWNRRNPTQTSGGSANAQTLAYTSAPAAYVQGQCFGFIAGLTNTGAATLNVSGLGAKNVYMDGAALTGGEIQAGSVVEVIYDGTQFQIMSSRAGFLTRAHNRLINPDFDIWQRGAGDSASFAVAASTTQYTADRWYLATGANQACTVGTAGTVVGGSKQSALLQRAAGQTGTGTLVFAQPLTTDQLIPLRGKIVSISAWAIAGNNFSPINGTVTMKLYCGTGAEAKRGGGFTSETLVASGSVNLMSGGVPTPAQQIFAVSGSAFPGNATQAEVRFEWTPTGTAGALDYVAFQRSMLFPGNLNLAFEPTRFADELARCQRHYWKTFPYGTAPAQNAGNGGIIEFGQILASGNHLALWGSHPTRMRVGPTGTIYNPAAANAQARNFPNNVDWSSCTLIALSESSWSMQGAPGGGTAAGNGNGIHLTMDAEL
jgi:hypothetical protein